MKGNVGRTHLSAATAATGVLLIAGCGTHAVASHASRKQLPAEVTITSGDVSGSGAAAVDHRPDRGVAVAAAGGTLTAVTFTDAAGHDVAGTLARGDTAWHSSWALAPSRTYTVTATAVNSQGSPTTATRTFRTFTPGRTFTASVDLGQHETVGVGMPIMVTFSRPITDKSQVERAFEIWSSKPVVGAWYWIDDEDAWFRPRNYWPAHTRVQFQAHLDGVRGASGVYGASDLRQDFTVGDSLVAAVSTRTHYMKVWWNGKLRFNWPISTGQPGDDTPDGQYLSIEMGNPVDMNSATYGVGPGDPGYYNVLVYDSVRFTWSGDYVHSAPWSVGEQGYANVSHGCVNVAPENAAWYYDHSVRGDPVTVTGSPVAGTWGDGWTIWFLSWQKLLAGSATRQQVESTPSPPR